MIQLVELCSLIMILFLFFMIIPADCSNSTDDVRGQASFLSHDIFPVVAKPQSSNSVLVTWDLYGYDIQEWYLSVFRDQQRISTTRYNPDTKNHMLLDLKPKTSYYVELESHNSDGKTLKAKPVKVTTLDESGGKTTQRNANATDYESQPPDMEYPLSKEGGKEPSGTDGILRWGLIVGGSSVGAIIFIAIVVAVFHKMQIRSDKHVLRRSFKKENKLVTTQEPGEEVKEIVTEKKEDKKEELNRDRNNQPSALLTVPQGNCRGNVYSGVSWGSEFDVLDQGDNVYSNPGSSTAIPLRESHTKPPPSIPKSPINTRPNQNEIFHSDNGITRSPVSHSSLRGPNQKAQSVAIDKKRCMTLPPKKYPINSRSTHQQEDWNTSQALCRVIKPQTSGSDLGVYGNVMVSDQNDLYVNSEAIQIDMPPPIPRR